jgi:hypothetical protein
MLTRPPNGGHIEVLKLYGAWAEPTILQNDNFAPAIIRNDNCGLYSKIQSSKLHHQSVQCQQPHRSRAGIKPTTTPKKTGTSKFRGMSAHRVIPCTGQALVTLPTLARSMLVQLVLLVWPRETDN